MDEECQTEPIVLCGENWPLAKMRRDIVYRFTVQLVDNAFEIKEVEFQNPMKVLLKIDLGAQGKRLPKAVWVVERLKRCGKSKTKAREPPRDPSVSLI